MSIDGSLDNFSRLIVDCRHATDDVLTGVRQFHDHLMNDGIDNREGISLLEVKNRDLLMYMAELVQLMRLISDGVTIEGDATIDRLVHIRTIIERIRPIEHKIKYQIDKLTKIASIGDDLIDDNKSYTGGHLRPRPENMNVSEDEEDDDDEVKMTSKKYVPPKLVAVRYDEDANDKAQQKVERARRRALNSSLVQDLRQQYSDAPEEIHEEGRSHRHRKDIAERTSYEEDMMVRLQITNQQKHANTVEQRRSALDSLLDFGDYMPSDPNKRFRGDGDDDDDEQQSKKKKLSSKHKKLKGKKIGVGKKNRSWKKKKK